MTKHNFEDDSTVLPLSRNKSSVAKGEMLLSVLADYLNDWLDYVQLIQTQIHDLKNQIYKLVQQIHDLKKSMYGLIQKIQEITSCIQSIKTDINTLKEGQCDLEWRLANENATLKEENKCLRQKVDIYSPDCLSVEDYMNYENSDE